MQKSCCIFFYEGYIGIAPTIINLVELLSEQGYSVTIYATKNEFPDYNFLNANIKVVYFTKGYSILINKILYKIFSLIGLITIIPVLESLTFSINSLTYTFINYRKIFLPHHFNIGVDTHGSIASLVISYLFKQKTVFLSLEIHSPDYFPKIAKIVKKIEKLAYSQAQCLLIQDQERFKSLCSFNSHIPEKVFYLPNSPRCKKADIKTSDNFFRKKFSLSDSDFPYLIAQAGMMCDYVFSQELAYAFKYINNGCALIFHEAQKREEEDKYVKTLKKINSKNLFLSLDPLPYEEIDKVFDAITIGIACYKNVNQNMAQIAKASGKLAQYLKYGKPVLVNNLDSLSQLVNKYKIGIIVKDPSDPKELNSAIELIVENYAFYSENSKQCFKEEFDFDGVASSFIAFVSSL